MNIPKLHKEPTGTQRLNIFINAPKAKLFGKPFDKQFDRVCLLKTRSVLRHIKLTCSDKKFR